MIKVQIAYAGSGAKVHRGSEGHGASASCMHNSLNGRLHSTIQIIEVAETNDWWADLNATKDAVREYAKANAEKFDFCGRCFK
jgi:hypothetical protein